MSPPHATSLNSRRRRALVADVASSLSPSRSSSLTPPPPHCPCTPVRPHGRFPLWRRDRPPRLARLRGTAGRLQAARAAQGVN